VVGLTSGVSQVATGWNFACALTTAGGVKCWGYNGYGQIGQNTYLSYYLTPVDVPGLTSGVVAIAAGGYHACAVRSTGQVVCWGDNSAGQCGTGALGNEYRSPTAVSNLSTATQIASGEYHTCVRTSAGAVLCWGANTSGQLGINNTTNKYTPTQVSNMSSGQVSVSANGYNTCARSSTNVVKCWGSNFYGQIGKGTAGGNQLTPYTLSGSYLGVACGADHTCALRTDGSVTCWGPNRGGSLGDGTLLDRYAPGASVVGF
jgi:alpha-tubulin suppressor-like RCC1 family protein